MEEPLYYPLRPLRYPLEHAPSPSPEQPLNGHSDPYHPADATWDPLGSHSAVPLAPLHPQRFQKSTLARHVRKYSWRTLKTPLGMALLPLFAIAYLAFCYTVHDKVVPISTYGLHNVTPRHLTTIKGGITSISIIIISIALYPIYDAISKLKSEEFFRVLESHGDGIPLETINHVSTPSYGYMDMMMGILRRRCSNYYILGIITSLLVWIVTTFAPGILTVASVLSDGELMAFSIGAVTPQSVLNGTSIGFPAFSSSLISDTAASVAWAEMELGVQYRFGVANNADFGYSAFIAPTPLDVSTTTAARWLSDVIGINPECSWASTNLTSPVQGVANLSLLGQSLATAYLLDFDLDVMVTSVDLAPNNSFVKIKDPTLALVNHTTQTILSDGATIFLVADCQSGCSTIVPNFTIDLTGINTTFTIILPGQTWSIAVLRCSPNITIETREVRHNGHGLYNVQPRPVDHQLRRQGNLNPLQTTALFSIAAMKLTESGGKLTGNLGHYSNVFGSQVQADVLFGLTRLLASMEESGTSATIKPAAIEEITRGYTKIIRSVTKSYLSGYLGTAYVPGRISQPQLVFAASIPNLAVSTVVFALLAMLLVISRFRPGKGVEFTLSNIAAAVHRSELPAQFARIRGDQKTREYGDLHRDMEGGSASEGIDSAVGTGEVRYPASDDLDNIAEIWGERRVFMQRREDGSRVLYMSCD